MPRVKLRASSKAPSPPASGSRNVHNQATNFSVLKRDPHALVLHVFKDLNYYLFSNLSSIRYQVSLNLKQREMALIPASVGSVLGKALLKYYQMYRYLSKENTLVPTSFGVSFSLTCSVLCHNILYIQESHGASPCCKSENRWTEVNVLLKQSMMATR